MWAALKQLIIQLFGLAAKNVDSLYKLSEAGNKLADTASKQAQSLAEEMDAELELKQIENRKRINEARQANGLNAMTNTQASDAVAQALALINPKSDDDNLPPTAGANVK